MSVDHGKIRGDLDDCQRALRAWWALPDVAVVGETELQRAVEALLRAVSTLAHGLEAEQPAAAGLEKTGVLVGFDRLGPNATVGMAVRYVPSDSDDDVAGWGANKPPAGTLDPEQTYVVSRVEVHSWHTKLWLEGAGGPFNSAHFVAAEKVAS